jgi:YHS domain-containing protein
MKRGFVLLLLCLPACRQAPPPARPAAPAAAAVKTIDTTPPQPAALQPPPVLTDEAPPPKSTVGQMTMDAPPPPTPQDEAVRASLPFSPAIGLDPVTGQKISIRATTPMVEMKGRVYYFSSEENKRTFMADPTPYLHGVFALPKS